MYNIELVYVLVGWEPNLGCPVLESVEGGWEQQPGPDLLIGPG